MKHIYEISKVETAVLYTNYILNDDGSRTEETTQEIHHAGLRTLDQLIENAKLKIAPDEDIEVKVAEDALN